MRYRVICVALLGLALAAPARAQITTHSTSTDGTMLAVSKMHNVTATPLYVRLIGTTLYFGEARSFSAGDGFLYQVSGTSVVIIDGTTNTVRPGEAIFIAGRKDFVIRAEPGEPSTYLRFLLSPAADLDQPDLSLGTGRELFRSKSPVPGLKQGTYNLSLTRVTLPHQTPSDPPHHRSGAALHFVLSGAGAETVSGTTIARGTGSFSYETTDLVYQWGNPGNGPLTYLVFDLSPENERPVAPGTDPSKNHL